MHVGSSRYKIGNREQPADELPLDVRGLLLRNRCGVWSLTGESGNAGQRGAWISEVQKAAMTALRFLPSGGYQVEIGRSGPFRRIQYSR